MATLSLRITVAEMDGFRTMQFEPSTQVSNAKYLQGFIPCNFLEFEKKEFQLENPKI